MRYSTRILHLCIGMPLCATGVYLGVQANIGLAPWDAFTMGITRLTGMGFGTASIWIGVVIILLDVLLKEKIGIGTIVNTLAVGWLIDLCNYIKLIPQAQSMTIGIPMLLFGQLLNSIGSYYYISAAFGCGPRDTLMVAFGKRLPRLPIGLIRGALETAVLLIGWLLGAKVGIGTILAVLGISFCLQGTFRFFHFEIRDVVHESLAETVRLLVRAKQPAKSEGAEDGR